MGFVTHLPSNTQYCGTVCGIVLLVASLYKRTPFFYFILLGKFLQKLLCSQVPQFHPTTMYSHIFTSTLFDIACKHLLNNPWVATYLRFWLLQYSLLISQFFLFYFINVCISSANSFRYLFIYYVIFISYPISSANSIRYLFICHISLFHILAHSS